MPEPTPQSGRYLLHRTDAMTRRRSGDPNPRGRLERADGLFRLRADLTAPGNIAFADALNLVAADWARQVASGTISHDLIKIYTSQLHGLVGVLARLGQSHVADIDTNTVIVWLKLPKQNGRPPARNVMAVRRSAVRSFFQTAFCLGLTDANPAKAVELPERTERYVHPLTDDQIRQLQRVARANIDDTRRPAALALVMSGAASVELGTVTLADVDLPNARVWVHDGGYRYRPRWLPLIDDWCVNAITSRVQAVPNDRYYLSDDPDRYLVHRPRGGNPSATPSKMADLLTTLLKDSGVYNPGVNRVESIREWCARQIHTNTGSIEQVALRLGMSSLDSAAHILDLDWVADLTTDAPPAHRAAHVAEAQP